MTVCHEHFAMYGTAKEDGRTWTEIDKLTQTCPDCILARRDRAEYIQQHDTLRADVQYGQHVAIHCRECGAEGTTKNIRPLGCRSLFLPCTCQTIENIEVVEEVSL